MHILQALIFTYFSFCDENCNNAECGYDAGDCGFAKYENLYQVQLPSIQSNKISGNWSVELPKGTTVAFFDFSELFKNLVDVGFVPVQDEIVRAISLSQQHNFMTLVLHFNAISTFNLILQGRNKETLKAVILQLTIKCDTSDHVPFIEPAEDFDYEEEMQLPDFVDNARSKDMDLDLSGVDPQKLNLTMTDAEHLDIIKDQLKAEELTLKGFNIKKSVILAKYVRRYIARGGRLEELLEHVDYEEDLKIDSKNKSIILNENSVKNVGRKLMDAYGDSMLHVNQIFNERYGFQNRLAISHMPFLIDKNIFQALKNRFPNEWEATAAHQLRQPVISRIQMSEFESRLSIFENRDSQFENSLNISG